MVSRCPHLAPWGVSHVQGVHRKWLSLPAFHHRPSRCVSIHPYMGVEPKIGVKPPKWMVKIMDNPIKMDDLGGKPTIFGNIHIEMILCRLTQIDITYYVTITDVDVKPTIIIGYIWHHDAYTVHHTSQIGISTALCSHWFHSIPYSLVHLQTSPFWPPSWGGIGSTCLALDPLDSKWSCNVACAMGDSKILMTYTPINFPMILSTNPRLNKSSPGMKVTGLPQTNQDRSGYAYGSVKIRHVTVNFLRFMAPNLPIYPLPLPWGSIKVSSESRM